MRHLTWFALGLGLASFAAPCGAQEAPVTPSGTMTFEVLDIGQGDSILIRSPEGKTALVDAGPTHQVVSLLKERGITSLDLVAVSHHHADHYGGMLEVVKQFHPKVFLATDSPHTSAHYLKLLEAVRDQGIRAIGPTSSPRTIELGSVELTVFPQAPNDPMEENNNSLGLRVQYGAFSALLPGDAEVAERRWWERAVPDLCRDAAVLKLAHHGSRNGTDAAWLELVRPHLAIASLGKDNEFGHPHRETLDVLARLKIPLLRTDQNGTVTIRTDGHSWQISSHPHVPTDRPLPARKHPRYARAEHQMKSKSPDQPVDVNSATEAELRTIPGVGAVIAKRIIGSRPYRSADDLRRVQGLGKKRLDEIRPYIRVE